MSSSDTDGVGITVHAVRAVTVHTSTSLGAIARVLTYGDEMVLTDEIIEANRDRLGRCALLERLDDPAGPLRRGPWPEGLDRMEPGSPAWDNARAAALQAAALLPEPDQQRAAAARVREKYGSTSGARSRTLAQYGPGR